MLQKSMGRVDWTQDAHKLDCLIRGLLSWPGAYTSYHGKTLKIWEEEVADEQAAGIEAKGEAAGTIVGVGKDAVYVQTGNGVLRLLALQLEGKKRMPVKDFLLGCHMQVGECLGEDA
jgi:methionyl-tRNA formyltransferase